MFCIVERMLFNPSEMVRREGLKTHFDTVNDLKPTTFVDLRNIPSVYPALGIDRFFGILLIYNQQKME